MHYSGAVYRPPSEARSLIVQCTLGCSHNKCAFCTMYKDKKFSINPIEQVLSDLDEARAYGRYIEKIFLADGDALILPMDYLLTVLDYIRDHFPTCKRVAAYATTKAIMRKTDDELRTLREHGLGIVYIGLESGNEELLKKFCKGVTAEEIVLNAIRCKQAGIATSVTAINGMAGANGDWQAHAIDTAKAVSRMKPDYIAFLTLRVYSGTPLHDWIASGEFKMMEPPELMRETRLFLEHIDSDGSIFRSNHASNYLPLGGTLNRDREALIRTIDEALDGKVRLRRAVAWCFIVGRGQRFCGFQLVFRAVKIEAVIQKPRERRMRGRADLVELADHALFPETGEHRMLPLQNVDGRRHIFPCLKHIGKAVAHAHERCHCAQQRHREIGHALFAPLLDERKQTADLVVEQPAGVVLFVERERAFPVLHVEQHVCHIETERHSAHLRVAVLRQQADSVRQ